MPTPNPNPNPNPNPSLLMKQIADVAAKRGVTPAQHVADREPFIRQAERRSVMREKLRPLADSAILRYLESDSFYAIRAFMDGLWRELKRDEYDAVSVEAGLWSASRRGREALYEAMLNSF